MIKDNITLINGDCFKEMQNIPDNTSACVFLSRLS